MNKGLTLATVLILVLASVFWYEALRSHPQPANPQKALAQAGEARKLTFDDADAVLDKAIGMLKMEVAREQKLRTWYEIDQNHPEAIKLRGELCTMAGATLVAEKDVVSMGQSPEFQSLTKSLTNEQNYEWMAKVREGTELAAKSNSLGRQLDAMGFNCGVKNEK
jgi:hypothetical protein